MKFNSKKLLILHILKTIQDEATIKQPISQEKISMILKEKGVSCDRKTVGRNINFLIEYGYPIIKLKGKGCYIKNNEKECLWT